MESKSGETQINPVVAIASFLLFKIQLNANWTIIHLIMPGEVDVTRASHIFGWLSIYSNDNPINSKIRDCIIRIGFPSPRLTKHFDRRRVKTAIKKSDGCVHVLPLAFQYY